MKRIAIYGNRHQDNYLGELGDFFGLLRSRGFEVTVASCFASYLVEEGLDRYWEKESEDFPEGVECVVSIGGDGTFLRAAQWVGKREIPILGINTGHLGFLASYSLDEMNELADVLANDLGSVEHRAVLELQCDAMPADFWPYALNEVAVLKGESASMVTVTAGIDGEFLSDYLADGLVVATPTGSTAYNLSAGGPILQPTLGCLVLSPLAPHSLTMRPLVVSGESRISLKATQRDHQARVSLDGRSFILGEDCGELEIRRADFSVAVLRRPGASFQTLLRDKLLWGKR